MNNNMPIRILHFAGTLLYGGVDSIVLNLYRNIDKSKIQFDFCVPRTERGPFDDEIEALGGRIFSVPRMQKTGILSYIKNVRDIIINNGPFYAVHIHSVHMGAITLAAAKKAGVERRIYHSHSTRDAVLDKLPFAGLIETLLKIEIRKCATDYLACGRDAGKYIYGNRLFSSGKVTIINNAIDIEKFKPYTIEQRKELRKNLNINQESIVIGNVARFSEEKNQKFIIKIVEDLVKRGFNITGLLIGDGPLLEMCKSLAVKLNVDKSVIFLGARNDVDQLYNIMDVFILPSLFEGLPITALEAQASGLPCIVSRNVTDEADLGINKYIQLDLTNSIEVWNKNILEAAKSIVLDKVKVKNRFSERNFDIVSVAKKLERIYLE